METLNKHDLICEAISITSNISFDYKDRDEEVYTTRCVSPHFVFYTKSDRSILLKANFVRGHTQSENASTNIRSYSIEKMKNVVILDESFEPDITLLPKQQTLQMGCSVF